MEGFLFQMIQGLDDEEEPGIRFGCILHFGLLDRAPFSYTHFEWHELSIDLLRTVNIDHGRPWLRPSYILRVPDRTNATKEVGQRMNENSMV